jgi:hypothetical protein
MSIHRIDIVSGIQPNGPTNFLDCCQICQTATVTFENVHNSNLNINGFLTDLTGSGLASVTVTAINGGAVSWPFFIAEGDTFTLDIAICWDGVTSPLGTWDGKFNTVEHGDDREWTFNMECVDWLTFWSLPGVVFDFTDTPTGSVGAQAVTLSNPTIGAIQINLDFSGCGTPEPIQSGAPTVIPPSSSGTILVTWAPTDVSDNVSCGPEWCGVSFGTTGSAIESICDCLCCENIQIQTDSGYLNTYDGFCASDIKYDKASFLDKKTVVFSLKYAFPLAAVWNIQFNPALFVGACVNPFNGINAALPVGYYIQYFPLSHPDYVAQPMTLLGAGTEVNNLRNYNAFFRPTEPLDGRFNIELTFYMVEDFEQFLTNITFNNFSKLKQNTLSSSIDYNNVTPSVYNSQKFLQGAFFMRDPNRIVDGNTFACNVTTCTAFTARFYNLGIGNSASEFTNPVFTLSRNSATVTNLSSIQPTKVNFSINVPAIYGTARPRIVFHLFDETGFDNSVDFLTATDSSRALVSAYSGTAVLDNHLVRPGTIAGGGPTWSGSLTVGTTVNPSSTYRMAAIVYGSDGNMVNTFLSNSLSVTRIPDMDCDCELDFSSNFTQYFQNNFTECFRPVGKERIGHRMIVGGGEFENCLNDFGFEFNDWHDRLLLVTLSIYKRRQNFPSIGKTTFFQFEQHQAVATNALPGGFTQPNNLVVTKIGTNLECVIWDRRVRWENSIFNTGSVSTANTNTYMNRTPAGPLGGFYASTVGMTNSWIDTDVFFEYTFTFNFSFDVGAPLFWNIVKAFKVNAIGFEPFNSGFEERLTNVSFEGQDIETGLWFPIDPPYCFSNYTAIRLTYQADREGNFIFFIEPEPFGISVIQENDEIASPTAHTELSIPLVLSQDTVFDPVTFTAQVVLNGAAFENKRYLFCGYISSPEAPAVCEYFVNHNKISGSSLIAFNNNPSVPDIVGTFNNVTSGRTLVVRTSNGETTYPIPGTTYVFEYSFSVPTTRPMDFRFGALAPSGPISLTLPIGSTSGSFSFVWGVDTSGFWNMITGAGTDMTGTFVFKLGNQLCP